MPASVNWWVHRIATSERYRVSPHEIRTMWKMREVLEAHEVLDAFDAARASTGGGRP
jgi:hypothetical protein